MRFAHRRRSFSRVARRGTATVEAALVLPVMLMFLFGILEYGRYIMTLQVLTNASRAGCRYAVTHTNPITIQGVTYGNATTDVTNIVSKALAGQQLTGQNIQVFAADSLGNNVGTWTSAQVGQYICVRITGNYSVIIASLLRLNTTIPVVAESVMRSEAN